MKQDPDMVKIQNNMQPGSLSAEGFLGDDDRNLTDIINEDDQIVKRHGSSHQEIASRLREMTGAAATGLGRPVSFSDDYIVSSEDHRGRIPCPFRDRFYADKRNTIAENRRTGKRLLWTDLNIHMIEVHGFYEGRGSSFRLEPAELVDFLFPESRRF
ncbi:hypothetical protein EOM86_02110 [Candidatus Nomurabacteria bacterium]|nr:hypothetical protein [Candidatus Nomurabacteria bacterium]